MEKKERTAVAFPVRLEPETGRFAMADEETAVKESIMLILKTQKTERFARPDFGSRSLACLFGGLTGAERYRLERQIQETVLSQEPRLEALQVKAQKRADSETLTVELRYRLRKQKKEEQTALTLTV